MNERFIKTPGQKLLWVVFAKGIIVFLVCWVSAWWSGRDLLTWDGTVYLIGLLLAQLIADVRLYWRERSGKL